MTCMCQMNQVLVEFLLDRTHTRFGVPSILFGGAIDWTASLLIRGLGFES